MTATHCCVKYSDGYSGIFTLDDLRENYTFHDQYEDVPVLQRGGSLVYGSMEYTLTFAQAETSFVGYVYKDGEILHTPRFYVDSETPAGIPTHVRLAR